MRVTLFSDDKYDADEDDLSGGCFLTRRRLLPFCASCETGPRPSSSSRALLLFSVLCLVLAQVVAAIKGCVEVM